MGRTLIDLSRAISHMMPVANPHINQVPAFWDRLTHEQTKGRWKHADISFHIRDFLIGEHVGTHVDALCHYDPRSDAPCLDKLPLDMFFTEAVCIDVSHVKPASFITVDDLKNGLGKAKLTVKKGDTFLYWQNYYARKEQPNWLHEFAGTRLGRGAMAGGSRRSEHRLRVREHRQFSGHAGRCKGRFSCASDLPRPWYA